MNIYFATNWDGWIQVHNAARGFAGSEVKRDVAPAASFPVLSAVLDAGGCAVSVDLCHRGAQLDERRGSVGNLRHVEIPLSLVLEASRKELARKSALVEVDHALTWAEMNGDVRLRLTRIANILEGAPEF